MAGWRTARRSADGSWSYPNEINWRTDATRAGDGGGVTTPLQARLGGVALHRRCQIPPPDRGARREGGAGALSEFNDNVFAIAPMGEAWRKALLAKAGGSDFGRYTAWANGADVASLTARTD